MTAQMRTGAIHHVRLTVTDLERAREFYSALLGCQVAMELETGVILTNGSVLVGLRPAPEQERAGKRDRFDENRVGLDHLSFSVASRQELEAAVRILDEHDVPHTEIRDLGPAFGIYVLIFRDPDNIQLELAAPYE